MDLQAHVKSLIPEAELTRRGFVVTSLATGFALVARPVSAEAVTTDMRGLVAGEVKIPVKDGQIPAYRAMPEAGGPFPVTLVVHEAFGVHEYLKDVCRRLAKLGHMGIAPELFARQGDASKYTLAEAQKLMADIVSKVPDEQVLSDLDAAAAWAGTTGKANMAKLSITGFCWGGRIVWLYAARNPRLKAAVAWYGPLEGATSPLKPKNPVDIANDVKAPVLGLYGGKDQGITQAAVAKMRAALKAAKKNAEIVVYPEAGHAFHADYRASYNADAAREGWNRMVGWLAAHGAG